MIAWRWSIIATAVVCVLACASSEDDEGRAVPQAAALESGTEPAWIEETLLSGATPLTKIQPGTGNPPVVMNSDPVHGDRMLMGGGGAAVFVKTGNAWQLESRLTPELTSDDWGFGHTVALSGDLLLVGAKQGGLFVFQLEGGTGVAQKRWTQRARLNNPCFDGPSADSAHALSLSAHTAVAACPDGVHLYARDGATLVHKHKVSSDPAEHEGSFGASIALDGNTLAIGSPFPDRGTFNPKNLPGRVHVYLRWGGNWYHQRRVTGSTPGFGAAVSISGDTLTVGSVDEPPNLASVSVFVRAGSEWTLQHAVPRILEFGVFPSLASTTDAVFFAPGTTAGYTIVRAGSTWREARALPLPGLWQPRVAVTARYAAVTHFDSATIFEPSGATWNATHTVGLHDPSAGLTTPTGSFSISGNKAALIREMSGQTYVFSRAGSHWAPQAAFEFPAPAPPGYDMGVAMSGDDLLVVQNRWAHEGPHLPPRILSGIGSASVQNQELVPDDPSVVLEGGFAVWQDLAVIGAYRSDTAYVFRRDGTEWKREAKLSMPDDGAGFEFGRAVDVRGDVAIVGAPRGLMSDLITDPTLSGEAGAAYVFVRSGGSWRPRPKLSPSDGNPSFGMAVSLLDGAAIVGAPLTTGAEATPRHIAGVHTYVHENDAWRPGVLLRASEHGGDPGEWFGYSLDAAADTLLVGALGARVPSAAYAFERAGGAWKLQQRFDDPADRAFGIHVAATDDRLVIGTLHGDPRVFRRSRTTVAGAPCARASECASNVCRDGVCCASACDGPCRSCALDLTGAADGVCADTLAGSRCGADALRCHSETTYQHARVCAAGQCTPSPSDRCQDNLRCLSAAGYCAWDCAALGGPLDELCSPEAWCRAATRTGEPATCVTDYVAGALCERHAQCASGQCETRDLPGCTLVGSPSCRESRCVGKQGDACTTHEHCSWDRNLHCADGVCCDKPCDGICESCNQDGLDALSKPRKGQCLPKAGEPALGHGSCRGTGICKGTCNGENRQECELKALECAPAACNGVKRAFLAARCREGDCPPREDVSCESFKCDSDAKACKTSCTSDADCADGTCGRDSLCTVAGARCSDAYNWRNPAGRVERCNGFCEPSGCSKNCLIDGDCLPGNTCGADKLCTATPDGGAGTGSTSNAEEAGSCDCRAAPGAAAADGRGGAGLLSLAFLFVLGARRRLRRSVQREAAPLCPGRQVTLLASLSAVSGCAIVGGYEEFSLRAEGGAGGGASCADASRPLTDHFMTVLDYGSGCFWMDSTEVSIGQYARFLSERPSVPPPPGCEDNVLEPAPGGSASCRNADRVQLDPQDGARPVVCVDWCDAADYCAWAGLTLCRDSVAEASVVQSSDWFAACSNGGTTRYPVRMLETNRTCNWAANLASGCDTGACIAEPVYGLDKCRNDAGVLHLSGNVSEWTSACNEAGDCATRGGAMNTQAADAPCASYSLERRDLRDATIGFRCCLRP